MNHFLRQLIRIWRWKHSNGFGVQSPTDYRFVCDIIYGMSFEHSDKGANRVEALYSRLVQYWKPKTVSVVGANSEQFLPIVRHACDAHVSTGYRLADAASPLRRLILVDADCLIDDSHLSRATFLPAVTDENLMVVVLGIHQNRPSCNKWKTILKDERVRISFDLYDVGILLFDPKRVKQDYIINF